MSSPILSRSEAFLDFLTQDFDSDAHGNQHLRTSLGSAFKFDGANDGGDDSSDSDASDEVPAPEPPPRRQSQTSVASLPAMLDVTGNANGNILVCAAPDDGCLSADDGSKTTLSSSNKEAPPAQYEDVDLTTWRSDATPLNPAAGLGPQKDDGNTAAAPTTIAVQQEPATPLPAPGDKEPTEAGKSVEDMHPRELKKFLGDHGIDYHEARDVAELRALAVTVHDGVRGAETGNI